MTHLGQGKGSSVLEGCRCEATWTPKGQRFSFAFQCHLSTTFLLAPLRSPANHTGQLLQGEEALIVPIPSILPGLAITQCHTHHLLDRRPNAEERAEAATAPTWERSAKQHLSDFLHMTDKRSRRCDLRHVTGQVLPTAQPLPQACIF
ncbi:unnamed protein product [Caretta caretta]